MIHVIPINDDSDHEVGTHCWCGPDVRFTGEGSICTHSSADHREAVEKLLGESLGPDKRWAIIDEASNSSMCVDRKDQIL